MSGAPVFAGGLPAGGGDRACAAGGPIGDHGGANDCSGGRPGHPDWGPGVADPVAWWARLGCRRSRRPAAAAGSAAASTGPAYRATLREFGRALHQRMPQLLGREHELAEIAAFATGGEGYRWLVGGAFTGRPHCCTRRSRSACRTRLTWCDTSCPGEHRMHPAAGSWRRWCRSWPTCATWTHRMRLWTSTTRCGNRRPAGPRRAGGICCWSLTGWTKTSTRPGRRASRACCRPWPAPTPMCW